MKIRRSEKKREKRKADRGQIAPALCNIIGTALIIAVIFTALPLTLPRLSGYMIYNVISGSMEPTLSVGSVIYAKYKEPSEIEKGEIIVYDHNGTVITHRVERNFEIDRCFITKGDANMNPDPDEVPYENYIGVMDRHFPIVGRFYSAYSSTVGKVYAGLLAACGLMLNLIATRLRYAMDYERESSDREESEEYKKELG